MLLKRFHQNVPLSLQHATQLGGVFPAMLQHELGNDHGRQVAGPRIALERHQPLDQFGASRDVAQPGPGTEDLRPTGDVDHILTAGQGTNRRRRPLCLEMQIGVTVVLDQWHASTANQIQQPFATCQWQDRTCRVLVSGNRVDEFRRPAIGVETIERFFQRIESQPLLVCGYADRLETITAEQRKGSGVAELLGDDRITGTRQCLGQQGERLSRTGAKQE